MIYTPWRSHGLFPLIPALSPGEREKHSPRVSVTERSRCAHPRKAVLPLPRGEGRGEGEERLGTSKAFKNRVTPCLPLGPQTDLFSAAIFTT